MESRLKRDPKEVPAQDSGAGAQPLKADEAPVPARKDEQCGIVMPIGLTDACGPEHWLDVRRIIEEGIRDAGLAPLMVSDADEVGVIHKRIIQNIYKLNVIVCDVSGRNANVMFELGMRLAFDKAVVIVKDDKTAYSFDTAVIEHLEYPRDLRYQRVLEFKARLTEKLSKTLAASRGAGYSAFLSSFGEYQVASVPRQEVSTAAFITETYNEIKSELARMNAVISSRLVVHTPHAVVARRRMREFILSWAEKATVHSKAKLVGSQDQICNDLCNEEYFLSVFRSPERLRDEAVRAIGSISEDDLAPF
jgi:hypothetical protein